MLSVKTNRDISEFKSDFAGGFDLREFSAIAAAVLLGSGFMVVLALCTPVPMVLCPYLALPVIAVPILVVFFNKNGMNLKEFRRQTQNFKKGFRLGYSSTESRNVTENVRAVTGGDEFDKTLKKVKVAGIVLILLTIILFAVMIFKFI
jgi:hypothetical protein